MIEKIRAPAEVRFDISGEIVQGKQLGRTIGFPTVNLICPERDDLLPNGVYIAAIEIFTGAYAGHIYPCVLNQGHQPTAPSGMPTVEAHIPHFSGDLYGAQVTITYIRYLRPEVKFPSLDALKAQLAVDTKAACDFFADNDIPAPDHP